MEARWDTGRFINLCKCSFAEARAFFSRTTGN
jgi:hypothetical protein